MTPLSATSARHIVLVEPHWHGHHGTYMRHFSRVLLSQGHRVTALCPFPDQPASWMASAHPDLAGRFHAFYFSRPAPVASGTPNAERAFTEKFWRETAKAIEAHGIAAPDLVFMNWLDTYIHPEVDGETIDRLFPHPWSGLYFFPGEHRGTSAYTGEALDRLQGAAPFRGRGCRGVALLDEIAQAPLAQLLAPRPAVVFPDLTDESVATGSSLADRVIQRAAGRKVIACVGSLCKRKGIYELIRICERSADRDWFFVFAGKLDLVDFDSRAIRDILRFVQHAPEHALVHLQIVPDGNDFNSLVSASDVLYCHYLAFPHSSNLLTKAAMLQRPVLVSDRYCMAERVRRHNLGLGVAEGDLDAVEAGLRQLLAAPRAEGRDFSGYFRRHATSRLHEPFGALLGHVAALAA